MQKILPAPLDRRREINASDCGGSEFFHTSRRCMKKAEKKRICCAEASDRRQVDLQDAGYPKKLA
jgi:hypothetical protein